MTTASASLSRLSSSCQSLKASCGSMSCWARKFSRLSSFGSATATTLTAGLSRFRCCAYTCAPRLPAPITATVTGSFATRSPLHCPRGYAAHEHALHEAEQQRDRHGRQHACRHHEVPIHHVLAGEAGQGQRDGKQGRVIQQRQRKQQLVPGVDERVDRKSTRLNSSHVAISYAVFCLKT